MHRLERRTKTDKKVPKEQRGIALLMSLLMITLLTTVVADFQFNSQVDLQLAANARDEVQAEYNALTALRLRTMMLKQSRKITDLIKNIAQGAGLPPNALPPVGQLLEMVPIDCGILSGILRKSDPDLFEDVPEGDDGAGMGSLFDGECSAVAESEHSKIAVNMLRANSKKKQDLIAAVLVGLLSDRKYERHFQEDDRNGVHAEDPAELVGAIADWTDDNDDQFKNQVSDEEMLYDGLRDDYRPKNAPFDSLAELQMVHGMDDELYALLSDNLSIYSSGEKLELSLAPAERIIYFVIPAILRPGYTMLDVPQESIVRLYRDIIELKSLFSTVNITILSTLMQTYGLETYLDLQKLKDVVSDSSSTTWYTINAVGKAGQSTRKITAVYQASEGQFYYARIQ